MTPAEQLQALISMTGNNRQEIARLLGYRSEASIRQCLQGRAALPEKKLQWLQAYAGIRNQQAIDLSLWMARNPPPSEWETTP